MISPTHIPAYIRPEMTLNIMSEKDIHSSQSGWTFSHKDTNTKIEHLTLKMTSHRIILFHPTKREIFNYEFSFDNIGTYNIEVIQKKINFFRLEEYFPKRPISSTSQ